MPEIDPLTHPWAEDQVAVMHGLRDWAVTFAELNHHLSSWIGLPVSDANALGQVIWAEVAGAPVSPAALSRRIGMTSGATSILLDRLERAGHVERHRESADRRRITLRATPSAHAESQRFLAFAGTEIATTVLATPPQDLRVVIDFLTRMRTAAAAANDRLVERRATTD
ncbi:MarR family winged helix-turn-helix transcriptional regulator [Curtobacterium sp. VKM Ac-2922]|uniref:MarR family winged helix-turn-helix transcriptional regulator n=1 Tax=Curtobacterium sp. VKM Ac-2922 TaxID=2929475 RepID=UPI001FB4DD78|nr:helix-turn-helix domain-containing protein [Curtobacterium sp. VKM Ac-2922]MCJ1714742.1 MarR family transcriptional regulator [Curtobacterium sp. VKM Ac-2922]